MSINDLPETCIRSSRVPKGRQPRGNRGPRQERPQPRRLPHLGEDCPSRSEPRQSSASSCTPKRHVSQTSGGVVCFHGLPVLNWLPTGHWPSCCSRQWRTGIKKLLFFQPSLPRTATRTTPTTRCQMNSAHTHCDAAIAARSSLARDTRHPNWVLTTTILASSLAFIDGSVVNVGLPALGATFRASAGDLQWVVNAYLLPLSALLLLGGAAGDRYGHARLLVVGI